jgi:uncharacterized protein YigA (DUF484 family)
MLTHEPDKLAPVLVGDLQHQFQIPQAAVRIWGTAPELAWLPCAAEVSDDVKIFATSLVAPYCGANSGFEAAGWFENADSVTSLALIPLRPDRQHAAFGLLALGSPDPTRYTADMGVDFLVQVGDIAGAALTRLLPR